MFVFGIVMALLGAILPALAGRLQFQVADIGTLFLVMNFGMLSCSLLLGLAMDRFGIKPPLTLGPLLVAVVLILIARATALIDLFPAVLLLGIGGGALNGATNTLIADLHPDQARKNAALNRLGVFFGMGALFLPFSIAALLARFSVASLLLLCSALCAVVGLFAAALHFPAPKQGHRLPLADMPQFLRSPLVLALACLLFFESGIEFTAGGFISTYLTRGLMHSSVAAASWTLAAYWASIMLARAVWSSGRFTLPPGSILLVSALSACCGAVLTAIASGPGMAALGVVLMGASLAAIYPTALSIAGSFFQSHSGTVFGILFTVALGGGMIVPWISGRLAESAGLPWVFGLIAGCFAAIALLSRLAARSTA